MTNTNQSEALRLAEMIEGDMSCIGDAEIVAELRRLHEVNAELLEALKVLVENGGIGSEDMFDDARTAIAKAEETK
jgi:hypothetical protein